MLPLLNFFGREISTYVLLGLAGFFSAIIAAGFRCKRYGFSRQEPVYIGLFAGMGLVLGGVLLYSLTQLPNMWQARGYFALYPVRFLLFLFGGMVFYGGLAGAVFGIFAYSRFFRASFDVAIKLAVPVFPLAHFFMRLGCFAAGCCYGIPHTLGIAFTRSVGAPNSVPLLPVQLFEAFLNLGLFALMWVYTEKERSWLHVVTLYVFVYAVLRFFLEFLRGDAIRGTIVGVPTSQLISAVLVAACVCVYLYYNRSQRAVTD